MPKTSDKRKKNITYRGVCIIRYMPNIDKWDLDAGLKLGGPKKYRKRFKTLQEAKVHAEQLKVHLKNQGTDAFKLTKAQQADAEEALKVLKDTKFNSLLEAVRFSKKFAAKEQSDITISELASDFMEVKLKENDRELRGASDATIEDYKFRHGILKKRFGKTLVREFTEKQFEKLFAEKNYSPHLLSKTKTLMNFAVKQGHIPENPIRIDAPKPKTHEPSIFTDPEWRRLITTAINSHSEDFSKGTKVELGTYITLGLWCGLRPQSEIERLKWEDIHLEEENPQVYIHPDWKVKHSRWVDIPGCAVTLLKKFQKEKGPVVNPTNLRRRLDWLKQEAKVRDQWSSDIMRHTFASMHYGFHGDKNAIANQLGHVGQGVLAHYINNGKRLKKRANGFFSFSAKP